MKRKIVGLAILALAVSLCLLAPSALFSAGSGVKKSHTRTSVWQWTFNPTTFETVKGTVARITLWKGRRAQPTTEWLSLKTDDGPVSVLLGPAFYVRKERVKINRGDSVSVTGCLVTRKGTTTLVATEIKKGNEELALLKPDGTPLWSTMVMHGE